jgi:hypothetical protein
MSNSFSIRQRLAEEAARRPFLRLVQHFAQRTVGGSDTASEVDFGLAGALAVLAVPGAFTAITLLNKYSTLLQWMRGQPQFNPYRVATPDEYFFIVYAMAITGLVTLLRWDHLLPGRRDFVNLAPLPLELRSIFMANTVALAGTALLFATAVNCFSSFFFPILVTMQAGPAAFIEFAGAHIAAVLGISLFTFVGLLAIQGLMMSLLPEAIYRRASMMVRTTLLVFFFALLVSAFIFPISAVNFRLGSRMAGAWWPPIWFLALFQSRVSELHNTTPVSEHIALLAVAIALALAVLSFTLSYRRYFLRIAERSEGPARSSGAAIFRLDWLRPVVHVWVKAGPESATYRFAVKTLLRSETHLLFLALWVGIGLLLSLEGLTANTRGLPVHGIPIGALMAAPLILAYAFVAGLRFVFDIPATLEANWVFRLAATEGMLAPESVCRNVMISFILPWLVAVWFPVAVWRMGWMDASLVLAADIAFVMLGIEIMLMNFRKIPFTCSFTGNRDQMLRLLLASLLTLLFGVPVLVGFDSGILKQPWKLGVVVGLAGVTIAWLRSHARASARATVFEDKGIEAFALLRLSGD